MRIPRSAWCLIGLGLLVPAGLRFGAARAGTVAIGGGSFVRGTESGEEDERPAVRIGISAFAVQSHEVTRAQYDTCVQRGACTPAHYDDGSCLLWTGSGFTSVRIPPKYQEPDFPVVCVTWRQARQYCRFKGMRLPTEAEWEYAALAGRTAPRYAWGNASPGSSRCAQPSDNGPRTVGSGPPNPWGLYDMTGNVWEWVEDRYRRDQYTRTQGADPEGPPVGRYRVIRGGGWYSGAARLRLRNRHWFDPFRAEASIGFRCVR